MPLLPFSRKEIEAYAFAHDLIWVEDESNYNPHFSRNLIRHEIIPHLQTRWPGIIATLSRTAIHFQQAHANLEALANLDYPGLEKTSTTLDITSIEKLQT